MFDDRLVVRFIDGRVLKGYGDNFLPGEDELLVQEVETATVHHVPLAEVKVVCFVREFISDSKMTHRRSPPLLYQPVPGRKVSMEFLDGELVEGVAQLQASPTKGFFVTPLNPNSNNIQLYINRKALKTFRFTD